MASAPPWTAPAELHSGDRMSREEFHRIYQTLPEDFRAELIGGIVYVASPLKKPHGTRHVSLSALLAAYEGHTPGVEAGDNATIILGDEDEPQPDLHLRILPEFGGQSRDTPDEYIEGAPELVAEIAHSSRSIDLHAKRQQYARFGVREYIVVCLRPRQLRWFDLQGNAEYTADAEETFRSVLFPGLWIHGEAVPTRDYRRSMAVLNQGLATAEHADFVRDLERRRGSGPARPGSP